MLGSLLVVSYSHCEITTMRFGKTVLLEALAASLLLLNPSPVRSFSHLGRNAVHYPARSAPKQQQQQHHTFLGSARKSSNASTEDCGCAEVMFAGDPSNNAKNINARQVIRNTPFCRVSGEPVCMDDLLGEPETSGVSIVVFLRSLG
jgi:hypothetical protein